MYIKKENQYGLISHKMAGFMLKRFFWYTKRVKKVLFFSENTTYFNCHWLHWNQVFPLDHPAAEEEPAGQANY